MLDYSIRQSRRRPGLAYGRDDGGSLLRWRIHTRNAGGPQGFGDRRGAVQFDVWVDWRGRVYTSSIHDYAEVLELIEELSANGDV